MTSEKLELDFTSDPFDIRNPETHIIDLTSINRPIIQYQPEYRRSLREYCSILYLKPRMKIVIRGKKVKTKLMSKSLSQTEMDVYKPTWLDKPIHITFGFTSSKNPEDYGIMMYHKNRLIKAFEKVGYQKQATALGVGVIGVVEANFLEPIHNKQDFSRTERYSAFITNVSTKLNDYWNEKTSGGSTQNRTEAQVKLPDWTWAQCDNCLKWRRLPTGLNAGGLPDKWYCRMNPDASFNRCDVEEEPEDDDEALQQPTYKKTFKKKLEEKKRAEEYEKMRKLQAKEQELKQREDALKRKSIQLSEEVSSSQDSGLGQKRPTVGDLDIAKKRLDVYKERLIEQQKIIMNLERQKKVIEEQSHDMLQMAEQLKLSNINTNNLIENVNLLAGTSSATVSSSSSVKRKTSGKDRPTKMFIKTEDGDTVTVIQNEVDEDDNVIDLTSDREVEEEDVEEEKQASNLNTSQKDVKPNVKGLDQAIKESKPVVELAHKTAQTVPVVIRLATRDEIDLEKLSPLEKRQHLVAKYREVCELQKKLEETNTRFKSLQGNICNLLKIIVPDFDYGQPDDIENVILDFIRVNGETDSKS
ncbi:hypothetical protein CHS0354_030011 [Potamilus streckersoni]|uniref:CW-type domain-containing protein n=1 Tax=Potamilus streckersoni TaxID=2493646 RepID=A0AAE0SML8_9BIVA|nr:hypothetical protein CHS0354_030011 [Potamilus streckersoni]